MAKRTKKQIQSNNGNSGCMWGFINVFDFRHGRPSHKLLADRKRGSRRIAVPHPGTASAGDELDKEEDSCEICKAVIASDQFETSALDKLSVKSLMEEEMFEQHIHSDSVPKQTNSDKQCHGRMKSWHAKKQSLDLNDIHFVSEKPAHRKHRSLSSLDVTGMVAELCSQVHVKEDGCLNHARTAEDVSTPPKEDSSITEERLGEATRIFVRHFVEGRNIEEGKIQPSGELVEALQILNSNKDMFLRLLRDPSSELVKHFENLEDHPVENSEVQAGSELIDQGKNKHQRFFWRRFKGVDRNSSKKNERPQDVSKIVVLKPQTAGKQSSRDIRSEDQDERGSSRYSFTELTRKLKLAMRKEQAYMGTVENVGGESLGRDHLFMEKIPKSSVGMKKVDKEGRSHGSGSTPEQRISNIYTEAKRHLAEIIGDVDDVEVDLLSSQVPKSLGKILSYSDYNSPPISSPRKDGEERLQNLVEESESENEITAQQVQEENASGVGSANNDSFITSEETRDCHEVQNDERSNLHSVVDEIHHDEGSKEMKSSDDFETENQICLDTLSEPCSPDTSRNELVEETPKDFEEESTLELNLDELVINRPSSPLASSLCSRTEDFEELEAIVDRSERPSPISVLEPIFIEDDASPPSIKSFPISELIQPRQIKFEDRISRAPPSRTRAEERNAVLEFVEAVVRASGLTHDQLLERFLFSDHLLDPALFDQVCFHSNDLGYDPKLLFDLVDDVLTETCSRDFDGIPSLYHSYMQLKLTRKNLVDEIRRGVDWHLQSEHTKHTLDQTIAKDFSKPWTWMDLRLDYEGIGVEMEEEIFDELVEDIITSFVSLDHWEETPTLPSKTQTQMKV